MAAARDGIDALLRDRGLRKTAPDLTGESLLRGATPARCSRGPGPTSKRARRERRRGGAGLGPAEHGAARSRAGAGASPLQAFARMHTLAGRARSTRRRSAGPATPGRPPGSTTWPAPCSPRPPRPRSWWPRSSTPSWPPPRRSSPTTAWSPRRRIVGARGPRRRPEALVVPEAGHLALQAQYESNLRGYREERPAGVHAWLLYAAEAYAAGAEASPVAG